MMAGWNKKIICTQPHGHVYYIQVHYATTELTHIMLCCWFSLHKEVIKSTRFVQLESKIG
jgi:6-pyruvoyl-tetrahydropterin synthase